MVQQRTVLITDDIGGEPDASTVGFALDGAAYEIDLIPEREGELRGILARYVEHARLAGASNGHVPRSTTTRAPRSRTSSAPRRPRGARPVTAAAGPGSRLASSVEGTAGRAGPLTTSGDAPAPGLPVVEESERDWLRDNGFPSVKERGKIPAAAHAVWEARQLERAKAAAIARAGADAAPPVNSSTP
jgi:nucleoid-associated protein Lsr2